MTNTLKMLAIAAAVAAGTSSAALAQTCPPGYALYGGVCQPAPSPGYTYAPNNPVSGAASGAANRFRSCRRAMLGKWPFRPSLGSIAPNRPSAKWRNPMSTKSQEGHNLLP